MSTATEQGMRILYVEDYEIQRETYLAHIRRRWGGQSLGVGTKWDAIRLIEDEEFVPELVIHDCQIPGSAGDAADYTHGNELYRFFRKLKIPVIVLTNSVADMQVLEPYRSEPPIDFFSKTPLNEEVIDAVVERYRRWKEEGK
jgi:CheY-like chemotaxis protein